MFSMAVSTVGDVVPLGALRFTTVWLLSLPLVISQRSSIVASRSSFLKWGVKLKVWRVVKASEL